MIKIGTSGFSFPDWVGPVYPEDMNKKDFLPYYEQELGFKCVEVNFTYYTLPSPKSFTGMSRKTSADFEFTVKAFRALTHDMIDLDTWKLADNSEQFEQFAHSLEPLVDDGKLACVLAQFPPFFYPRKENYDYLRQFKEKVGGVPVVVEFRNKGWMKESTFEFLKENGLGYCVVDEPKIPRLMPYQPGATSQIGYFRFHGRNTKWFKTPVKERYDYLYSEEELTEFVPDVRKVADETDRAFIFFNNCTRGQAAQNAEMMKKLLGLIREHSGTSGESPDK